jgi:hypothetical protein
MTLTLGEHAITPNKRELPPPSTFDPGTVYPKEYPEVRSPHPHLLDWFEKHPPEIPAVRCRPVEPPLRTQEDRDIDYLCKPIEPIAPPTEPYFAGLIRERDMYQNRYHWTMFVLILLLALSGWVGWNQMQRIRGYQAENAYLKAHTAVVDYSTVNPPRDAEGHATKNGGSDAIAPPTDVRGHTDEFGNWYPEEETR